MAQRGENHASAKLTEKEVAWARHAHEDLKLCNNCIAHLLGIHRQTVYDAITYRTWVHVRPMPPGARWGPV